MVAIALAIAPIIKNVHADGCILCRDARTFLLTVS